MHPLIRILTFLVLGAFLALGRPWHLLLAAALIGLGYALAGGVRPAEAWRMLRRLRWLFASILLLYLWFTPGTLLVEQWGRGSPTLEGLQLGVLRVLALVLIVLAVSLLLQSTSREALLAALLRLLAPLGALGLARERLAVRIVLTLEVVGEVQSLLGESLARRPRDEGRLRQIGAAVLGAFQQVIDRAERSPARAVPLPEQAAPAWYQWGYPLGCAVLFGVLR